MYEFLNALRIMRGVFLWVKVLYGGMLYCGRCGVSPVLAPVI